MYSLYNIDCIEFMKTLEAQSIDAIITDLPYGTTTCKWDVIIPFAPMWEQVKRVCKGVFVTTASQPFTSTLIVSNLKWFKYEWIWRKSRPTGFQFAKYAPMREHENITVFSENGHTYNPIKTKKPVPIKRRYPTVKSKSSNMTSSKIAEGYWTHSNPKTIIDISQERGFHPTQKPVALYEYLIHIYTNEGDTVLDFCMGSGTTGVACMKTNRNFIGCDNDTEYGYFAIAEKRIYEASQQPLLF